MVAQIDPGIADLKARHARSEALRKEASEIVAEVDGLLERLTAALERAKAARPRAGRA